MEFELIVDTSTYKRWVGDEYIIAMYSYRGSPSGMVEVPPYYRAYNSDSLNISMQSKKGFSSFEEAKAACELYKLKNDGE